MNTKIKAYSDKATDVQYKEMSMPSFNHICLLVIIIDFDSALKRKENYHPKWFLK